MLLSCHERPFLILPSWEHFILLLIIDENVKTKLQECRLLREYLPLHMDNEWELGGSESHSDILTTVVPKLQTLLKDKITGKIFSRIFALHKIIS